MTFYSGHTLTAAELNAMLADIAAAATNAQITALQNQINTLNGQVTSLQTATADTGWIALPLSGTWVHYGAPFSVPGYRKIGQVVHLRGLLKSGTPGSTIGTLPAGYRPPYQILVPSVDAVLFGNTVAGQTGIPTTNLTGAASAGTAHTHPMNATNHRHDEGTIGASMPNVAIRLDITTAGGISHTASGSNAFASLDGISFLAA